MLRVQRLAFSPVYDFTWASRGMEAVMVCHVRAKTCPWARTSIWPRFSNSLYWGASRVTAPEMSTSPASTVSPWATSASPLRGSIWVTMPEDRATMLPTCSSSSTSGAGTASRTSTSARVPWRLTDIQASSGRPSRAALLMVPSSSPGPYTPGRSPCRRSSVRISAVETASLPSTSMVSTN